MVYAENTKTADPPGGHTAYKDGTYYAIFAGLTAVPDDIPDSAEKVRAAARGSVKGANP